MSAMAFTEQVTLLMDSVSVSSFWKDDSLQCLPAVELLSKLDGSSLPQGCVPEQAVAVVDVTDAKPLQNLANSLPSVWIESSSALTTCPAIEVFKGKGGLAVVVTLASGERLMALPGSRLVLPGLTVVVAQTPGEWVITQPDVKTAAKVVPAVPVPRPQGITTQAMILGAGLATRFEPVSGERTGVSKPGAPLAGSYSVIGGIVAHLAQFGITDIFINTYFLPAQLKNSLLSVAEKCGVALHYLDEMAPSGTAGAIRQLLANPLPWFDATKPLLLVQGDAVTNADMAGLLEAHQANSAMATLGCLTVGDDDVSKFGIIATDQSDTDGVSGHIQTFLEKPALDEAGPHRLANTGFYVFAPQAFPEILAAYQAAGQPDVFDYALHVFPYLLNQAKQGESALGMRPVFWAQQIQGYWGDIGNPMQYWHTAHDVMTHPEWFPWFSADVMPDGRLPSLEGCRLTESGAIIWPTVSTSFFADVSLITEGAVVVAKPA